MINKRTLTKDMRDEPIIKFLVKNPVNIHLIRNNDFFQRYIAWHKAYNNLNFFNNFFAELKKEEVILSYQERRQLGFSIAIFFHAHSEGLMEVDWDRLFKMKKNKLVEYISVNYELFELELPHLVKEFELTLKKFEEDKGFSK